MTKGTKIKMELGSVLPLDFGIVQKYNIERGFDFISSSFNNYTIFAEEDCFFHITTIKRRHNELAKRLDSDSFDDIRFWYEVEETEKGKQVSKLWLSAKDIPPSYNLDDFILHIENFWQNINIPAPIWLDFVTIDLVGQKRRDELNKNREQLQCEQKAAEEQRRVEKSMRLPSPRERFRAERGIIENIFTFDGLHGLPDDLKKIVRPCPRKSRTNPLSHVPGGSDVVVAYSHGDAIWYDWIKRVPAYIATFQKSNPEFHLHIQAIYGRFSEHKSENRIGVFCSIWDRDKDGAGRDAIRACCQRYQRQMDIGHKTLHEEAVSYWKKEYGLSDQEAENLPTLYEQYLKKHDSERYEQYLKEHDPERYEQYLKEHDPERYEQYLEATRGTIL